MRPPKHTVWAVVAAFLSGVCIDRVFFRAGEDATISSSGSKNAKKSASATAVPNVVLSDEQKQKKQQQEEEEDDRYAAAMIPAPYPFEDGLRSVAPSAGGVLANARAVYAEIKAEVLVRARVCVVRGKAGSLRQAVIVVLLCANISMCRRSA